jgi:hypothetical protein
MLISSNKSTNTDTLVNKKIDYNPIYKVNYLVNGSIDTTFIFYGKNKESEDEEDLFKKIFTPKEIDEINSKKLTPPVFLEEKIHYDDSISTIKIKILNQIKNKTSFDEIYLFCQKKETFTAISLYQSLTQNKKLELTKIRLQQFISNIVSDENGNPFIPPPEKDVYTFEDILEMKIEGKTYIVNKVLGQKFFIVENEYPFVCNPYNITDYDRFFEKNARKSLTTLNSHLLLNSGDIIDNNIYLCLANDVLSFVSKKKNLEENTLKIYYPFLYNKNIRTLEQLRDEQENLIEQNKKYINDKTEDLFKTISMFYDVYKLKKTELKYIDKGIKYIKAIIKPDFDIKIPLEIIFKIIHATEKNPFIKYNPSSRQENIYRLYTDKISTDGRKIPYLKKTTIFKLMKTIAKTKSVSVFIEINNNDTTQIIICDFDENGYITVTSEFNSIVSEHDIDMLFRDSINPIINEIKNLLQQSGYKLNLFNSLYDDNIEIKQLTYVSQIKILRELNLETYKGCISAVFNNESSEFKTGIYLRFKRVSNFSKVSSQEAFILEKSAEGYRGDDIIEALLENFSNDLTRNQAEDLVRKVANEIQVERGVRKSDIKIKNNPGFKTTIMLEQKTGVITITVENINDIHYLQTIPIYLDTIIRLTQDKNSTNYPIDEINKLCSTGEKEEVSIKDTVSSTEKRAEDIEVPVLDPEDETVDYQKYKTVQTDKPKIAFNLFYDDDEENEENEETEGGQPNNSSEESSIESDKSLEPDKSLESFGEEDVDSPVGEAVDSPVADIVVPPAAKTVGEAVDSPVTDIVVPPAAKTVGEAVDSPVEDIVVPPAAKTVGEAVKEVGFPLLPGFTRVPIEDASDESTSSIPDLEPVIQQKDIPQKAITQKKIKKTSESEEDEVRNIDGMKLNKPYYFQTLIENKDPILILKEDSAQFNAYSRTCSSDTRRQPVILTDEQLAKINKEHKGFLRDEDVIKYGSNPNNQFNYICPRYWCLKTNTIIDPSELKEVIGKDGKTELQHPTCGKVIPRKDKEVKPGYYIYEFYEPEHKKLDKYEKTFNKNDTDKDGLINFLEFKKILKDLKETHSEKSMSEMFEYVDTDKDNKINFNEFIVATTPKKYPGLIPDKHPNGLCLPCCFDKYNTEGRITANKKCYEENKKEKADEQIKQVAQTKADKKVKEIVQTKADKKVKEVLPVNVQQEKADEKVSPVKDIIRQEKADEKVSPVKDIIRQEKAAENIPEQDEYIKGPDKFPLTPGRWGYLPFGIEQMLRHKNIDCQISKTNTNIKPDHFCLLRHGIEINKNQSFIACISDILFFIITDDKGKKKFGKILSIKEMRDKIIDSITIDSFVTYQNGNLVTDFHDMKNIDDIDAEKYKETTKLFSKLNSENQNDLYYMKKVVSAFENFMRFLQDEHAIIDHTYLWDIISMPNKDLFESGLNILIFQLPNDDITNNVQLLCPTNHYAKEYFNSNKPTVIILKQDEYYEPIYLYVVNEKKQFDAITQFKEKGTKITPELRYVFNAIIKPQMDILCKPLDSMPNVYKAKRPLFLYELIKELRELKYLIEKLVVNFNNKVIGVVAEEPNKSRSGFVPCYPSSIPENNNYDIVFMNDLSLWNTYYNTVGFLSNLAKRSKNRKNAIPCKPWKKIVEDVFVVGILTETNQFIQLSQPVTELEADDDFKLDSIKNNNYIINEEIKKDTKPLIPIDLPVLTNNNVDEERVEAIQKIKMETGFYNVFRNTIRILLNDYENVKIREEIEKVLTKEYIIYSEKLQNINDLLLILVDGKKNKKSIIASDENEEQDGIIKFTGDDNYYKLINQISTCIVKNEDECNETPNLCTFTKDGRCNLILPKNNLITKKRNKPIYFKRMADELIRYSRINSFMLQPQTYLSFGNIGYNLNDNEIIMIQSLLTQDYFDTLIPAVTNKYTKFNSYDEVEPILTQMYDNTIPSIDTVIEIKDKEICVEPKINNNITSTIWKKCFPDDYKDIEYNNTTICTFQFIIDLIARFTGYKYTINKIKNDLYEEYKQYLDKYQAKIIDILIMEGKKALGKIAKKNEKDDISFSTFISDVNYFLTTLDLWLLVKKYEIPTIFISQNCILQTKYEKHAFLAYGKENDNFVFILLPGFNETKPNYKVIQNGDGEIFISPRYLTCEQYINEIIQNKMSFEEYLISFTKPSTTNYQSKTKCKEIDKVHQEAEKPKKAKKLIVEEGDVPPAEKPKKVTKAKKLIVEGDEPPIEAEKPKKVTKAKKLIVEGDEPPVEAEKPKKQTKKQKTSPENKGTRKRCPNGMKRNEQGECVDKNK